MLLQLNITNFAIIKHLEFSLGQGLNILSGETGAGKSIIINAINLVLGGRSSSDLIRTGCNEAVVEALFSFPENRLLNEMMAKSGLPFDGELLIRRSIFREGRNRVLINGSMATLQMLSRIGPNLISISGQHEHQLLLTPDNHLYLLDDFSGIEEERNDLSAHFGRYLSLKEEVQALEGKIVEQEERQDLCRFQIQEIEGAQPLPAEDKALFEEKRRLQHAEELLEIVSEGYQSLYERNDSVGSTIARCAKRISRGAEIDRGLDSIRDVLSEIEAKVEDVSFALRDFEKTVHMDPHRLEQVVERLEILNRLKRKYGATIEDVLRFKDDLFLKKHDQDTMSKRRDQLKTGQEQMEEEVLERARALSDKRRKEAGAFERAVERELQQLHMEATDFRVRVEGGGDRKGDPSTVGIEDVRPDGLDRVEFLVSPNPGEELRSLSKTASGGELSRIMLAIKTILAGTASVETIIFDEVDSGISGATAEVVGEKLSSLAEYHQILCITHLPQIAGQGQTHFQAKKSVMDGRTQATITELDREARVREIARLLGGRNITPSAMAHAEDMLGKR